MGILTVKNMSHRFGDRAIFEDLSFRLLDELKRALKEYEGSILLVCHEVEFYRDIVTDIWNCEEWAIIF